MFKALLLEKDDAGFRAGLATLDEARLPEGDVLVQPEYSTINFKDGLAPVSYTHLVGCCWSHNHFTRRVSCPRSRLIIAATAAGG